MSTYFFTPVLLKGSAASEVASLTQELTPGTPHKALSPPQEISSADLLMIFMNVPFRKKHQEYDPLNQQEWFVLTFVLRFTTLSV